MIIPYFIKCFLNMPAPTTSMGNVFMSPPHMYFFFFFFFQKKTKQKQKKPLLRPSVSLFLTTILLDILIKQK